MLLVNICYIVNCLYIIVYVCSRPKQCTWCCLDVPDNELSHRIQIAVQIVSKPPAPSPIYRFLTSRPCGPAGWLVLLLIKAVHVETNPGPTTSHKRVSICDICYKQIHVRKQILIRCNRIEHWVHLRCAGIRQHNTQIPGPAIYTENPDSHITQT